MMTRNPFQIEQGFSLVETIIYIALFIALSALLIDALIVMGKSYTESRATRDVLASAEIATERIEREVQGATAIQGNLSTFDAPGGVLALKGVDTNGAADTVVFSLSNGQITVSKNSGAAVPITDPHVSVDSLVFRDIISGSAEAVRVEATYRSLKSVTGKTITVDDTALVRTVSS